MKLKIILLNFNITLLKVLNFAIKKRISYVSKTNNNPYWDVLLFGLKTQAIRV